jgi:UDP-N-acetylglucosamine 2-epimerase (non-hydrolysing)
MATTVVAAKLHIPVAHVEAGLRSRDMSMPEEINRLMTDVVADLLFTPSADADENLRREGVVEARIHRVGNIMIDTLVDKVEKARGNGAVQRHGLAPQGYGVVTLHRPSNVDDPASLEAILRVLAAADLPLVFPVHPRTRKVMKDNGLAAKLDLDASHLRIVDPLGYDEFMNLVIHAKLVLTDSGGLQEETTWLRIPCLTLRPNTERPITIEIGTNELATVATLPGQIARILADRWKEGRVPELWDGATAPRIVDVIEGFLAGR